MVGDYLETRDELERLRLVDGRIAVAAVVFRRARAVTSLTYRCSSIVCYGGS